MAHKGAPRSDPQGDPYRRAKIGGRIDIPTGATTINVAQLALEHWENKNLRQPYSCLR
ncbi:hypothetical protein OG21DRAFT_1484805 [Imleria badia]|nr:hypothetical protein OG21DRAFT_1484805 [Imleria badia]